MTQGFPIVVDELSGATDSADGFDDSRMYIMELLRISKNQKNFFGGDELNPSEESYGTDRLHKSFSPEYGTVI